MNLLPIFDYVYPNILLYDLKYNVNIKVLVKMEYVMNTKVIQNTKNSKNANKIQVMSHYKIKR